MKLPICSPRRRRRSVAAALGGLLAWGAVALADPAPLACLPPRATSCEPHEKKDPNASVRSPVLRPVLATLFYVHTHEAIVLEPEPDDREPELLARFLRDRTSWEPHEIAAPCIATIRRACKALGGRRVEIVSGYRSDKLNELLRKKGHRVARHSEHSLGHAVDFRIRNVPTRALLRFVRREHVGGIGFYPDSGFVHVDIGRARQWRGE